MRQEWLGTFRTGVFLLVFLGDLSQSNWKPLQIYFIRSIHWDLVGSKLVGLHIPVDCHILVFPVWLGSPSCRHINHYSNYRTWAFWDWPAFVEQTGGGSSRWSFTCCRNEVWWRMSCGVRHCKLSFHFLSPNNLCPCSEYLHNSQFLFLVYSSDFKLLH